MKVSELRQRTKSDLNKLLQEKREALRQFHFDLAAGKVKNIKQARASKKDIARILTILKNQK